MTRMMRTITMALPIVSGICWGCCGVFVRVLDKAEFNNITITFSRVFIVVILLDITLLVYDRNLFRIELRQLPLVALIGICGQLLFNIAFKFMDSSIVSILASGAEPTSALFFGLLVYREVPTVFGFVGTVLVIVAIIILTKAVSAGK